MAIHNDALVSVIVADYIGTDPAGKANILGGGFAITGLQPTGASAPMYVAVIIDVPSRHRGDEFPLSIDLYDDTLSTVVQIPGPTGQVEALRFQQLAKAEAPVAPFYLPDVMFSRVQAVLAFPNGLPLTAGHFYSWRVQIEGQGRPGWRAQFHVAGPPPQPVFGGPAGPADISNLPPA